MWLAAMDRQIAEVTGTYADFHRLRARFFRDIFERGFAIGDSLALIHHSMAEIDTTESADRHHAAIMIRAAANAADGLVTDPFPERS